MMNADIFDSGFFYSIVCLGEHLRAVVRKPVCPIILCDGRTLRPLTDHVLQRISNVSISWNVVWFRRDLVN